MKIIKYLQLPFFFDVKKMQQEVLHLSKALWTLHYQVTQYQGEWSALPLRSINGATDNIYISPIENANYCNTNLLKECNYFQEILAEFKCNLKAVRLLKLSAGAKILEHIDADLCYEKGEARFHVPIHTNNEIDFNVFGEKLELKEGECWYINFNLPHSIYNNSSFERIHLVIDVDVNDWVRNLFNSLSIKNKMEIEQPPIHTKEEIQQMIERFKEMNTETANTLATEWQFKLDNLVNPLAI